MKIRTEDELQDVIDSEIAWRKKELSAVKANIKYSTQLCKEYSVACWNYFALCTLGRCDKKFSLLLFGLCFQFKNPL